MNGEERNRLRETSFREQVETIIAVAEQLEGWWVIQRFQFDEWRGIRINPLMTDDPVHEEYPVSGTLTYATSSEAVDATIALNEKFPYVLMRVGPVAEDIRATRLLPRTRSEKLIFGEYPRWGELLKKCGGAENVLAQCDGQYDRFEPASTFGLVEQIS